MGALKASRHASRPMAQASDTTQCSTPCIETGDEAELSGGLPVMSRSAFTAKLLKGSATAEPPSSRDVEESLVPSLTEVLDKLDDHSGAAASTYLGDCPDFQRDSLPSCWEAHQYQQPSGSNKLVDAGRFCNPKMIHDVREHFDAKFQDTESSWLQGELNHRTARPSVSEETSESSQQKAADVSGKDKSEYPVNEDGEHETYSGYMSELLRGKKDKAKDHGEDPKLKAKPPNKRTEVLPGVRMAGAKQKKSAKPPMSAKRIEELKKMLRHANAGGSLDTLFEEDDDPDSKIPDCDVLFGGRALLRTSVPQVFTCVSDALRDDWKHVPRSDR